MGRGPSLNCWALSWCRCLIANSMIVMLTETMFCEQQLPATDASARTTMKGAAKCDKRCELQNSVNQQGFERILCFRDIPESIPVSVSITLIPRRVALHGCAHAGVFVCQDVLTLTHVVYLSRTRYRPIIKALYAHFSCVSRARAYLYAHICLTM